MAKLLLFCFVVATSDHKKQTSNKLSYFGLIGNGGNHEQIEKRGISS
jgi:hypothetical protein